jgi:tol-pal system protein YbgF
MMALGPGRWFFAAGIFIQVSTVALAEVADKVELEQRLHRLERIVQGQGLAELLLQVEQLQGEVRRLQGESEELRHEITHLREQQRELYLDLDRRLQQLSQEKEKLSPASPVEDAADMPVEPSAASAADSGEESYQAALGLLKEGRYGDAVSAFRQFLQHYPDSHYRPNAQYWQGEALYVLGDFKAAAVVFQALAKEYPASPKVPDAMLKQGLAYYELEQWEQAKIQLQEVVARFPASTVSRLAEEHLEKMKRKGHI